VFRDVLVTFLALVAALALLFLGIVIATAWVDHVERRKWGRR